MSATMQALVKDASAPQHVTFQEVDRPIPKANEALVRVRAIGLNRGELTFIGFVPDGTRLGFELSGEVVQAAQDGSGPRVGARVAAFVQQDAWAEYVAVPTDRLAGLAEHVSFAVAASFPMAGSTALDSMTQLGELKGKHILVTAGRGNVGSLQVQLALKAGAQVTAISREAAALQSKEQQHVEWLQEVSKAPIVFDAVLDGVGGITLGAALQKTKPGATIISFGNTSGQPTPLSYYDVMNGHNGLTLHFLEVVPTAEKLEHLAELFASKTLQLAVRQFAWHDIDAALAALGERSGEKIVCVLDETHSF